MSDLQPESEPFKVIDRRGQPKPGKTVTPPDFISDIKDTDDPLTFIAVMPGNRVQEHKFKLSRLEASGVKMLKNKATGIGPQGRKAIHAARMKILKVMENAMRVHLSTDDAPKVDATAVLGPRLVQ